MKNYETLFKKIGQKRWYKTGNEYTMIDHAVLEVNTTPKGYEKLIRKIKRGLK
jgi:hypothetical protein